MAANFATATVQTMITPPEGAVIQGSTKSRQLEAATVVSAAGVTTVVAPKKFVEISGQIQVRGNAGLALAIAATGTDGQLLVTQVDQSYDVGDFPSGTIDVAGYANL